MPPHDRSHRWSPLEDIPPNLDVPGSREIEALLSVWRDHYQRLKDREALEKFTERLVRELAIETGILERLYDLDRGVTQVLIEHGIHAALLPADPQQPDREHVAELLQSQLEGTQSLFDFVRRDRVLSAGYIKELHALLTRGQDSTQALSTTGQTMRVALRKGEWKVRPNNPARRNGTVHEYAPPEQVASEMDRLVELHRAHRSTTPPVPAALEAAWLHHRFTQIHPFQDGNGRVARCLASLVFLQRGGFPLVIDRDHRPEYLDALETADSGDLAPLVAFMARLEKRAIIQALSVAQTVEKEARVSQVIASARDRLRSRARALEEEWREVRARGEQLWERVSARLDEICEELNTKLGELEAGFRVRTRHEPADGERSHWFRHQLISTARSLGYFADPRVFHAWNQLTIDDGSPGATHVIWISFHGLGRDSTGILGVSACYFERSPSDTDLREIDEVTTLPEEVFQINFAEDFSSIRSRFDGWLEEVLIAGLETWRRGL